MISKKFRLKGSIANANRALLAFAAAAMCASMHCGAFELTHRWSFNGDYADSIGGSDGVVVGRADQLSFEASAFGGQMVKMASDNTDNDSNNGASLNLGTGVLGTDDATIEMWAKRNAVRNWARIFDYGPDNNQYIFMSWSRGTAAAQDQVEVKNKFSRTETMSPYVDGTLYHIVMTLKKNNDGSTTLAWARRNTVTGVVEKHDSYTQAGWTLADLTSPIFYLGHSQWPSDRDANASYDEVRIYSGIVGDEQLAANAVLGPDAAPAPSGADASTGVVIPAGATFKFPDGAYDGNAYAVSGTVTMGAGAKIVFDTANGSGADMVFSAAAFSLPTGVASILDMVELTDSANFQATLSGTTITVASKLSAVWTGDAGDGDWQTAGNWKDGVVPTANTPVFIGGDKMNLQLPVGTSFACRSITLEACTFTADCDWRGLQVVPGISGIADLAGHNLTLSALTASAGAEFKNSAETDGEVRFYADGDPVTATESGFITGIENLKSADNAKLVIIRTSDADAANSVLNLGAANNTTVFRAGGHGTITTSGRGNIGVVNGGSGRLEVTGNVLDFSVDGLTIGGNAAASKSSVEISDGKILTNWIDAGDANGLECTIVQSGGEVWTGINNNGNLWLGRWSGSDVNYGMSGGVIHQGGTNHDRGSFQVACYSGSKTTFDMTGGTIYGFDMYVGAGGNGTFTQNGGEIRTRDLRMANGNGSVGTYIMNEGTNTFTGWVRLGLHTGGKCAYTQNGGEVTCPLRIQVGESGPATFTLNGGTFTAGDNSSIGTGEAGNGQVFITGGKLRINGNFQVGQSGVGLLEQSGGEVSCTAGWFAPGRFVKGVGTYRLTGGTYASTANPAAIGEEGRATFDVSGTGIAYFEKGTRLGHQATGVGTLYVRNGGKVVTPFIEKGPGSGTVVFDGGTVESSADGAILSGVGNVAYMNGGVTFDTAGHNVKITGCNSSATPGSKAVKTGEGTLEVEALPPVATMQVEKGTLAISANADNSASASLAHRWSFTAGSLGDSVGGLTATTIPATDAALVYENNAVAMTGDGNSKGSLNLGKGIVPAGNATIEIWATRTAAKNWSRVFDYGTSSTDYITMSWVRGTNGGQDEFELCQGGTKYASTDNMGYVNNEKYHISMTITVNDNKTSTFTWTRRNVETGNIERTTTSTPAAEWDLAKLAHANFYLGHSQYGADADANAIYDEVRIWNGVLSDDALNLSARLGPDATAEQIAAIAAANGGEGTSAARTLVLDAGTSLELNGNTLVQPVVKGTGTVYGGTLKVTDKLVVKTGEMLLAGGTVDLDGAKVSLVDPENLSGIFTFLKAPNSQVLAIVGTPVPENLPSGWMVTTSGGVGKIMRCGCTIYVR